MKLSIQQQSLKKALSKLNKGFGKDSIPNFLVMAWDYELFIARYTYHSFLSVTVPAEIEKDGEIAVPGKLFKELVGGMSKKQRLKLEVVGEDLVVNSSVLPGSLDLKQFPNFNRGALKGRVSFPDGNLVLSGNAPIQVRVPVSVFDAMGKKGSAIKIEEYENYITVSYDNCFVVHKN